MKPCRKPYPSDVSDEEWALVAPCLTLLPEEAGQREHGLREAFNGLRYILKTGAPWRWRPNALPPWPAVRQQARRWLAAGCFKARVEDLRVALRLAAGRAAEPSAAILDSRTLRSTPESGERAGHDGAKRRKGSQVHVALDTLGHLRALHVAPASAEDRGEVGRLARESPGRATASPRAASRSPGSIRAARASAPGKPPPGMASLSRSSNCRRPGAASSSCPAAGGWSDPSHGQPASEGSSRIASDTPRPSQDSTSSPSLL